MPTKTTGPRATGWRWRAELEHLRLEHRDLDAAIEALLQMGSADRLQVQRLKKRKLALKDRMSFLDDQD